MHVGILTELMLSYRALEDWSGMIGIYEAMPEPLRQQVRIRQQVAFAYNRRAEATCSAEDRAQALLILEDLEQEQGSDPETSGLIGRIYKSQWLEANAKHDDVKADQCLRKAVDAYVRGFLADWRQVYPGINAVTLLEAQGDDESLSFKDRLLPVVRFAAEQRLAGPHPSYWDYATILEIAVLAGDTAKAGAVLRDVLATYAETWQPSTTARNLRIIEGARREHGDDVAWIQRLIGQLDAAAAISGGESVQATPQ